MIEWDIQDNATMIQGAVQDAMMELESTWWLLRYQCPPWWLCVCLFLVWKLLFFATLVPCLTSKSTTRPEQHFLWNFGRPSERLRWRVCQGSDPGDIRCVLCRLPFTASVIWIGKMEFFHRFLYLKEAFSQKRPGWYNPYLFHIDTRKLETLPIRGARQIPCDQRGPWQGSKG